MTQPTDELSELYVEAFDWYQPKRPVPPIEVSFYPYIGINHTIRVRDNRVIVRIGDVCRDMPRACHKGLAYILVGKLLNKKIPAGARAVYSAFSRSDVIRERATASKRVRGRKVVTTAKGTVYDLEEIFADINQAYFRNTIPKPQLTWSARKTFRILGHHDATHDHITISRSLDSANVPRYVVEYVVFHEMLHIHHPTRHVNGRRYSHTPEFRRDERKFVRYDQAERWIEQNVRHLKQEAKKR